MAEERHSFFVDRVDRDVDGWRLTGEPGFDRQFWPRVGTVLDAAVSPDGEERAVELVVTGVDEGTLTVRGRGGDLVRTGDLLVGTRPAAD